MNSQKVKKIGGLFILLVMVVIALVFLYEKNSEFINGLMGVRKPAKLSPEIIYLPAPKALDEFPRTEKLPRVDMQTLPVEPTKIPKNTAGTVTDLDKEEMTDSHQAEALHSKETSLTFKPSYYDKSRKLFEEITFQKLLNEKEVLINTARAERINALRLEMDFQIDTAQLNEVLKKMSSKPVEASKVEPASGSKSEVKSEVKSENHTHDDGDHIDTTNKSTTQSYSDIKLLALYPDNATAVVAINGSLHTVSELSQVGDILFYTIEWLSQTIRVKEHGKSQTIAINTQRNMSQLEVGADTGVSDGQ